MLVIVLAVGYRYMTVRGWVWNVIITIWYYIMSWGNSRAWISRLDTLATPSVVHTSGTAAALRHINGQYEYGADGRAEKKNGQSI